MLIPVRAVATVFLKSNKTERGWYIFYKDTGLPIPIFHTPHVIRLHVGNALYDFKLQKEKLPLCVGGVERVVLYLEIVLDQDGTLVKNLKQDWSLVEHVSDAEDFVKTPELPKIKNTRTKKVKVAS